MRRSWLCALLLPSLGAAERPPWRLDLTAGADSYTAQRNDEYELSLALGRKLPGRWTGVASTSVERRFGAEDHDYEGWLYTPGIGPAYGWAMVSVAPANHFLPDWQSELGCEAEWINGTGVVGHLRYRHYPSEQLWQPGGEVRQQILPWLALEGGYAWTISDTNAANATTGTALAALRGTILGRETRIFATYGRENNPPAPVADVLVLGGMMRWPVDERLTTRIDVAWEDRHGYYKRFGAALTGTVRF